MESAEMGRRHAQAGEMLPLLKRHEIQVLLRAGHSHRDVAEQTGASLDTIARVKREDGVSEVDDATDAPSVHRHRGAPQGHEGFVRRWAPARCPVVRRCHGARRARLPGCRLPRRDHRRSHSSVKGLLGTGLTCPAIRRS